MHHTQILHAFLLRCLRLFPNNFSFSFSCSFCGTHFPLIFHYESLYPLSFRNLENLMNKCYSQTLPNLTHCFFDNISYSFYSKFHFSFSFHISYHFISHPLCEYIGLMYFKVKTKRKNKQKINFFTRYTIFSRFFNCYDVICF